jgi:hypothetical protein
MHRSLGRGTQQSKQRMMLQLIHRHIRRCGFDRPPASKPLTHGLGVDDDRPPHTLDRHIVFQHEMDEHSLIASVIIMGMRMPLGSTTMELAASNDHQAIMQYGKVPEVGPLMRIHQTCRHDLQLRTVRARPTSLRIAYHAMHCTLQHAFGDVVVHARTCRQGMET